MDFCAGRKKKSASCRARSLQACTAGEEELLDAARRSALLDAARRSERAKRRHWQYRRARSLPAGRRSNRVRCWASKQRRRCWLTLCAGISDFVRGVGSRESDPRGKTFAQRLRSLRVDGTGSGTVITSSGTVILLYFFGWPPPPAPCLCHRQKW